MQNVPLALNCIFSLISLQITSASATLTSPWSVEAAHGACRHHLAPSPSHLCASESCWSSKAQVRCHLFHTSLQSSQREG